MKEEKKIFSFKKERKYLIYLSSSIGGVAILFLFYNFYSCSIEKKTEEILKKSSASSDELKQVYQTLHSQHIFANIHIAEEPPSKQGEKKIFESSILSMKKNEPLGEDEIKFFKIHPSYWLYAMDITKLEEGVLFNNQDKEFLNILLQVRKTASHNGFVFSIYLLIISFIIFIAFLISKIIWH